MAIAPNNGASKDFLTPIGFLEVTGPGVLPFAAQMFTCIRSRQCELNGAFGARFGSHGPVEIVDFPIENGDFPIQNGDLPIQNGDFPELC
jgi:hypothetical protein